MSADLGAGRAGFICELFRRTLNLLRDNFSNDVLRLPGQGQMIALRFKHSGLV